MRRIYCRWISCMLIVILVVTLLPSVSLLAAEAEGQCGEHVIWTLQDGTLTIQGSGDMYDSLTYGSVPWRSYSGSIKRVEVLTGVSSVCDYAFYRCTNLTSVSLADSVITIGYRVFCGCTALTSVRLSSHLTLIPYEGFLQCRSLTSIEIPNSVTTIGTDAFQDCDGLTSITIPDSVSDLGQYAFYGCDNLKTASIGIGANGLGYNVFANCPKLQAVHVAAANPYISSLDGVVYTKYKDELLFHPMANGTSITIPNSVLSIGYRAFLENYTGLASHESMLKHIYFEGNAPTFGTECFGGVTANLYYPRDNPTWTKEIQEDYGGKITWLTYESHVPLISITDCQVTLAYEAIAWTYGPQYPEVTVTYQSTTLKEGVHYCVDYDNNREIGTATVTVTGLGSYTGHVCKNFIIHKANQSLELSIPDHVLEVGYSSQITAIGTRGLNYITFTSLRPEIASVNQSGKVTALSTGTAVIAVTTQANELYYPLSKTIRVIVIPEEDGPYDINRCQIRMTTGNQSYTGSPRKAYFSIMRGDTYLRENFDYTVTCSNCTNVGTATAVVTGIGDYTGSARFTYEIVKAGQSVTASISPETILVGETAQITADGIGTLTYRSDDPDIATVDTSGKVTGLAVGSALVEVQAAGDQNHNAASHCVRLHVEASSEANVDDPGTIPISSCTCTLKTSSYVYDGNPKCPEVKVTYGSTTLTSGTDYTVSYHNNINAGYPTATVVGKGDYAGSSKALTYEIRKASQTVHISTLSPLMLKVGESAQIEAIGLGRLSYFTSDANNSLEIGMYTGIVTGLAPGSVQVIAHASGDNNHLPGDAYISVQVVAADSATIASDNSSLKTDNPISESDYSIYASEAESDGKSLGAGVDLETTGNDLGTRQESEIKESKQSETQGLQTLTEEVEEDTETGILLPTVLRWLFKAWSMMKDIVQNDMI